MAKRPSAEDQKEEKERMAFYLTSAQKEKVRLLAIEDDVTQSKIVGDLIDAAREPAFKRG
ncbi:hypothetical protein GZ982_30405 (plasmid) [Pseudomonas fluorescens]|nr:hypothetical protein GZ982_30405 [Pseudomonas fluorescens]